VAFDFLQRLRRASECTAEASLDGLLVATGPDLLYLTGYDPPPLERLTALVIRPGRDPLLLVPELERQRAEASPVGRAVDIECWSDGDDPYQLVGALLPAEGTFAVSDRMWASHLIGLQANRPDGTFGTASGVLTPLRARKDHGEIQLLRRAARGADHAFNRIAREALQGRTELDVARSLATYLEEEGHESVAFTIVAAGPNGASPHHEPGDRGIRDGDSVVMDFGGRVHRYCSDITRTIVVGPPSEELEEVHEIVRRAQDAALRAVAPGVPAEEVDRAARAVIEEAGYGDAFVHRTGHGIGLEEHEAPFIVRGNAEPLQEGMCFSVEPGIYLEGRFGVRIEDIVAVTADGAVRLNHATRDLLAVG
jgi:D-alanyl-D-alanine dipeptidase